MDDLVGTGMDFLGGIIKLRQQVGLGCVNWVTRREWRIMTSLWPPRRS